MTKEYIAKLKVKREKIVRDIQNLTLDISSKTQELETMKVNRERLVGIIAAYNEEIQELEKEILEKENKALHIVEDGQEKEEKKIIDE